MTGSTLQPGFVYEFKPEFTAADLRRFMDTTYDEPLILPADIDDDAGRVQIVAAQVRAVFTHFQGPDYPTGCYKYPDWEIIGWLPKSGFDPYPEVIWVRLVVIVDPSGPELTNCLLHWIEPPTWDNTLPRQAPEIP